MKVVDETNFKPLRALVLVRRDDPDAEIDGIIIPGNVRTYGWRATVIRSGSDATSYQPGEVILFLKEYTVLPFKDRTLALTDSKHILAKLQISKGVELIMPMNKFVLVEPHPAPFKDAGLYLSDKSKPPPKTGYVIRRGPDTKEIRLNCSVWFDVNIGVNCVEDGVSYKLLSEDNILAMQNGN
jgi:co-chaperonin GroES (HSP10)